MPLNANISGDSLGAVTDSETTRCSGAAFGKTLWYRFVVPRAGTATIDASGYPAAISLYAGASTAQLACAPGSSGNATSLARHLAPGTYYAQVGGRGAGVGAARGDLNFKVNFVADPDGGGGGGGGPVQQPPVDPDTDGDGLVDSQDCAPTDPKRRAGFKEVRGNKVDEDCDRVAQDFREVRARRGPVTYLATSSTLLRSFLVNRISKGDKVTITCKGQGCRTKRVVKTFRKARARYDFRRELRRNRPRPGAVVEVRVTHAKRIGHVWRFTFRSYKAPKLKEDLCLRPGASKAKPCP